MIFRIRKYFFQKNNVIQYGHLNYRYVKTKTKHVYLDEIANYLIALSSFLCKSTCVHNWIKSTIRSDDRMGSSAYTDKTQKENDPN